MGVTARAESRVTLERGTGSLTLYQGSISDSTAVVANGLVNLCADDYALYLVDEENCTDSRLGAPMQAGCLIV